MIIRERERETMGERERETGRERDRERERERERSVNLSDVPVLSGQKNKLMANTDFFKVHIGQNTWNGYALRSITLLGGMSQAQRCK